MQSKDKKNSLFAILMLMAAVICLLFVFVFTISAFREMGNEYHALKGRDLSEDFSATIIYDDHLYAMLGYGIMNDPLDPGRAEYLSSFLKTSIRSIDERIFSADVLYTMMITSFMSLFLYERYGSEKKKHVLMIAVCVFPVFFLLSGSSFIFSSIRDIPFYLSSGNSLLCLMIGMICIIGGHCFLAFLIRKVRFRKIVSLIAIPVIFFVFLFSAAFEGGLLMSPYIDSFDHVYDVIPQEKWDDLYYDEEKNVLILDGNEYEAKQIENPDHLKGLSAIGAIAFELIDPYSGNSIEMIRQIIDSPIPLWILFLYLLKSFIWIFVSLKY